MEFPKIKGKKIVVFGGLGFIGRNLLALLLENKAKVTATTRELTGKNQKLIKDIKSLKVVECDIVDIKTVRKIITPSTDIIVNLAGHSGPVVSIDSPYLDVHSNIIGPLNVLEVARQEVKNAPVVFIGSRLEYGTPEDLPVDEKHPIKPKTIYAVDKFASGQYHVIYNKLYSSKTIVLRGSNVYGPHIFGTDPAYNVINYFIDLAIKGKTIKLFGGGKQKRDHVYVKDFCEAIIMTATNKKAYGKIFNVGYGKGFSQYKAAKTIVKAAGSGKVKKVAWPKKYSKIETGDYISDVNKIKKEIDWEPRTTFKKGVNQTLSAMEENTLLGKLLQI